MSYSVGEAVTGVVSGITAYGAFVRLECGLNGMIHISKLSQAYVSDINSVIKVGDKVTARVISNQNGRIALSMLPEKPKTPNFETMLSAYKAISESNLANINSRNKKKRR